ncbi:hypothetical protein PNH50_09960 [Leisingera aquaemixtae]
MFDDSIITNSEFRGAGTPAAVLLAAQIHGGSATCLHCPEQARITARPT